MAAALVTGGTSGIGAEFARQLAHQGYDLVLVARDEARLSSTADELSALGVDVETLVADLSDRSDVDRVASRLEDATRPVDVLVNNAGFGMHVPLTAPDVAAHDRGFEVMCRAVLVLSGAAARGMRDRGHGRIINVSSTAGLLAMGTYSAIKAWVTSFSEGLSVELRGTGVTVTALLPGWVRTEFHQRAAIGTSKIPNSLWLDTEQLVSAALRDVDRGKVISIPTVRYKVLVGLLRHAPKGRRAPSLGGHLVEPVIDAPRGGRAQAGRVVTVGETGDAQVSDPEAPEPEHTNYPRLSKVAGRVSNTAVDINDRFNSGIHASARFVAQRWVMKPTVWSITNVTVLGREKLKGLEGGFVLIANHSSHLDAPLIVGALPRKLSRYLATGAAADYFFDVWWRRGLTRLFFNAFPIQRTGRDKKKRRSRLRQDPSVSAASLLQRGFPVLVFPEGTRSKDGTVAKFKPGAARLAAACDVPIVPLALIGANIAHPRGSHWPRPGRLPVGVAFGEPMRPMVGENPVAFSERLRDEILRLKSQYSADILGSSAPSEGAHP